MFWCSRSSDGYKAVSCWPVSGVMQPGVLKLSSSKQSNPAPATPPAHAMVSQSSPWPQCRSAFLQETSTCPAGICDLQTSQHCVSSRTLPSCLLPPERKRKELPQTILPPRDWKQMLYFSASDLHCCIHSSQLLFLPPFEISVLSGLSWTRLVPA